MQEVENWSSGSSSASSSPSSISFSKGLGGSHSWIDSGISGSHSRHPSRSICGQKSTALYKRDFFRHTVKINTISRASHPHLSTQCIAAGIGRTANINHQWHLLYFCLDRLTLSGSRMCGSGPSWGTLFCSSVTEGWHITWWPLAPKLKNKVKVPPPPTMICEPPQQHRFLSPPPAAFSAYPFWPALTPWQCR